jgi:hypothetical protein
MNASGTHLNVGPDGIEWVNGGVFHDTGQAARNTMRPKRSATVPFFPIGTGVVVIVVGSVVSVVQSANHLCGRFIVMLSVTHCVLCLE